MMRLRRLSEVYQSLPGLAYCVHCQEWFMDDLPSTHNSLRCPNKCGFAVMRGYNLADYLKAKKGSAGADPRPG